LIEHALKRPRRERLDHIQSADSAMDQHEHGYRHTAGSNMQ